MRRLLISFTAVNSSLIETKPFDLQECYGYEHTFIFFNTSLNISTLVHKARPQNCSSCKLYPCICYSSCICLIWLLSHVAYAGMEQVLFHIQYAVLCCCWNHLHCSLHRDDCHSLLCLSKCFKQVCVDVLLKIGPSGGDDVSNIPMYINECEFIFPHHLNGCCVVD